MLRYTVALVPKGNEDRSFEIGRAEVWNVGGDETTGNYKARLRGGFPCWSGKGIWKRGDVLNFARARLGAWDLLYRALAACIADRSVATRGPTDVDNSSGPSLAALETIVNADPLVMAGIGATLDAMGNEGQAVAEILRGIKESS
jgi:hypothetical protein